MLQIPTRRSGYVKLWIRSSVSPSLLDLAGQLQETYLEAKLSMSSGKMHLNMQEMIIDVSGYLLSTFLFFIPKRSLYRLGLPSLGNLLFYFSHESTL